MQVHNRYLVAETREGVTIIDQHALHERILYEQLRRGSTPAPWRRKTYWCPSRWTLARPRPPPPCRTKTCWGDWACRIESFGGDTVLVTGFPAMLANMNPVEVFRGLLERLLAGGKDPDRRDLLDELLHAIACKAAVKAGDRLAPAEIASLLEQRHLVHDPHHCPHGRPTALVFTREELDRQFKRI